MTFDDDLALASRAGHGEPEALAAVMALCRAEVAAAAPRFRKLTVGIDEVEQRLHTHLFVRRADGPPRILDYRGASPLSAWLRVAVRRMLLNLVTRERPEIPSDDAYFEAMTDGADDAELELARRQRHGAFAEALAAAAAGLDVRERCLLRYAYADRKTVEQIGAIYGVHGATASRWVTKARARLLASLREELMARLQVTEGAAALALREALSRIELSISRVFPPPVSSMK